VSIKPLVLAYKMMLSMWGRRLRMLLFGSGGRVITETSARSGEAGGTPAEAGTAMAVSE
jgi:hypothetical protein